ncbi:antichymotrypsin-2-like isoform X2 [Choristoneura fumiferana]|uniref:antichymotrypsin-2-like isoform X2 n=1 Tax=Choristoneura fumiferana TaxID=7141 RepID=UPI003D1586F7
MTCVLFQLMRSTCLLTLLLLVILTNKTGCSTNMDSAALSSAIAKFSLQFCNELDKSKSVVSSPMSAEILLALLTLGSSDPAHGELLNAIGFKDDDSIRSSFSAVTSKLKSVKGVTLQVANKVYLQNGFDLDPKLKHDAIEIFDSDLEPLDFSNSGAAAKLINDWVESKTNKRIKDLISEDSVNSLTRLVLVNALYFKGSWKYPFKPHNTIDKPFHINKDTTVNVPMMYLEENFKYGESQKLNAQLLEMPYEGGEASMVIILPKEVEGINDLLKSLATDVDLVQELNQMHPIKVQVTIPKFKIETEIDLKTLLPKLGISAIFDESNSGLTKIFNSPEPLYVSKAIQKAFIEVNEEGAEAAAATAMNIAMCCAMVDFDPVKVFLADRPFLAVIQVNGAPYFLTTHRGN